MIIFLSNDHNEWVFMEEIDVYVTRNQFICAIVGYNMNHLKAHQSMDTMENDPF